jgi:hypothetical protein
MNTHTRTAAARAFVRSLNILLKFARMYDFGHPRTAKQYAIAWNELSTAIGTSGDNEAGLLLAVSGDQLLLDGTPLESAAAERGFARMLSAAGIASIHFSPKVTQSSLARLVRGFPTGNSTKPALLAEQLKSSLEGDPHVHVNEVCFVPADSAVAKSTMAAQLAAHTLNMSSAQTEELLNDPNKLLQLIVAAEGSKNPAGGGAGQGGGNGEGGGPGSGDGGSDGGGGFGGGGGYRYGGGYGYGHGGGRGGHGAEQSGAGGGSSHGDGAGSGSGQGSGPANGVAGTGAASGSEGSGATGAYSGGGSIYAQETPEIVRDFGGFMPGAGNAVYTDGYVSPATTGGSSGAGPGGISAGPSTWNIVGSGEPSGQGTPLTSDVAGFWLNGSPQANNAATEGGSSVPGAAPVGGFGGGFGGQGGEGVVGSGSGVGSGTGGGTSGRRGGGGRLRGSSARVLEGTGVAGGEVGGGGPVSRWGNATAEIRGQRSGQVGNGSMAVETGLMTLHEDELKGILQMLAQIARTGEGANDKIDPGTFQSRLSTLPRRARFTVSQALSALAAQSPTEASDKSTLLKLAEHIAIRYAMESFERGDIEVNAVNRVMTEMSAELDGLRKILGAYEETMARHGLQVGSHVELLAQQFWAQVTDEKRKSVLESGEAWCVPSAKVREYVEQQVARGDKDGAEETLRNYASCIEQKSPEARRLTATGLAELAPMFTQCNDALLVDTIRRVGVQLASETDSQMQSLLSAAFVRLSQEAANKRSYPAVQRSVELVDYVESERPGLGKNLRPRIGVENRLPEFIDEAIKATTVPPALLDLFRRIPIPAATHLATRFSRTGFREDCDMLVSIMHVLGPEALDYLREQLRTGNANEAIVAMGILTRVDAETVQQILPDRMREWKRAAHDRVVRQIAASGALDRGRLLLDLFDTLDPTVRPLAVDEIGMAGEQTADMRLLRLAEGDLPDDGTDFLRLKAMEALGRLRTSGAESVLRKIAEARRAFRWSNPSELRVVAAQAMERIDPEWVRHFVPRSGLNVAEFTIEPLDRDTESSAIRQRRYPRLRLERPVAAMTTNLKENCRVEIPELTLGGGVAVSEQSLHPGSVVDLKLTTGGKSVKAQAIVRDANTQARAFEVIEMDLEERAKLRRLLVQIGNTQKQSSPKERTHGATRVIIS